MRACVDCGRTVPAPATRCPAHAAPHAADVALRQAEAHLRRRLLGRTRKDVRRAMADAVARAGRCETCGSRELLHAHLPGGGVHPPDPDAYVTLCASCHQRLESKVRRARQR